MHERTRMPMFPTVAPSRPGRRRTRKGGGVPPPGSESSSRSPPAALITIFFPRGSKLSGRSLAVLGTEVAVAVAFAAEAGLGRPDPSLGDEEKVAVRTKPRAQP